MKTYEEALKDAWRDWVAGGAGELDQHLAEVAKDIFPIRKYDRVFAVQLALSWARFLAGDFEKYRDWTYEEQLNAVLEDRELIPPPNQWSDEVMMPWDPTGDDVLYNELDVLKMLQVWWNTLVAEGEDTVAIEDILRLTKIVILWGNHWIRDGLEPKKLLRLAEKATTSRTIMLPFSWFTHENAKRYRGMRIITDAAYHGKSSQLRKELATKFEQGKLDRLKPPPWEIIEAVLDQHLPPREEEDSLKSALWGALLPKNELSAESDEARNLWTPTILDELDSDLASMPPSSLFIAGLRAWNLEDYNKGWEIVDHLTAELMKEQPRSPFFTHALEAYKAFERGFRDESRQHLLTLQELLDHE